MKLSELTTDQAADVLIEITPYVANISGDSALMSELEVTAGAKSIAQIYLIGAKKISAIVPLLLKDHRVDVYGILSVLNNKTPEEVGKQNIMVTMNQVKEVLQDKEMNDFFASFRQEAKTE